MHLELKMNDQMTAVFMSILNEFHAEVQLCFNRKSGFVDILCKSVLCHVQLQTLFTQSDVQSSTPFVIQFNPTAVVEHHRRLHKKVSCSLQLRQIAEKKSVELLFEFFKENDPAALASRFPLQILLKAKNNYAAYEQELALYQNAMATFDQSDKLAIPLPKENVFGLFPITADEYMELFCQIENGSRTISVTQKTHTTELSCACAQPQQQQQIQLKTADFTSVTELVQNVKRLIGGQFGAVFSFNEALAVYQLQAGEEFFYAQVPAGEV